MGPVDGIGFPSRRRRFAMEVDGAMATDVSHALACLETLHDPKTEDDTRRKADECLQRFQKAPGGCLASLQALRRHGRTQLQPHQARFLAAVALRKASKDVLDPNTFEEAAVAALADTCDPQTRAIAAQCAVVTRIRRLEPQQSAHETVRELLQWRQEVRCEAVDAAVARMGIDATRKDVHMPPERRQELRDALRGERWMWQLLEERIDSHPKETFEDAAPIADASCQVAHVLLGRAFDHIDARMQEEPLGGWQGVNRNKPSKRQEVDDDDDDVTAAAAEMICAACSSKDPEACLSMLPRALQCLERVHRGQLGGLRARAAFDVLATIANSTRKQAVLLLAEGMEGESWRADPNRRRNAEALLQTMLRGIDDEDGEVAMIALGYWSDLRADMENESMRLAPGASSVFGALLDALLRRAQLKGQAASVQSADARDLPESERVVRREVGVELRMLATFLGPAHVLKNIEEALHLEHLPWERKEALLYAANVVLNRMQDDAVSGLSLNIANAALQALDGNIHPKLSGTALTLLGGIPGFLSKHPSVLRDVVLSVGRTLHSKEPTLSRNAATAFQRLARNPHCAAMLSDPALIEELLKIYSGMGPPPTRAGEYGDVSTEEMLLASLARLATGLDASTAEVVYSHICQDSSQWVEALSKQGFNPSTIAGALEYLPLKLNVLGIVSQAVVERYYDCPTETGAQNMSLLMGMIWPVVEVSRSLLEASLSSGSFLNRMDATMAVVDLLRSFLPCTPGEEELPDSTHNLAPSTVHWMQHTMKHIPYFYHITEEHGLVELLQRIILLAKTAHIKSSIHECSESLCVGALKTLENAGGCADAVARVVAAILQLGIVWSTTFIGDGADEQRLQILAAFARPSMEAQDRSVGEAALSWCVALCQLAANQNPAAISYLSSGGGTAICTSCLEAAGGKMPPWMVQPISASLHKMWHTVGFEHFGPWLRGSAVEFMRARGMSKLHVIESMADRLVGADSWSDPKKFKAQLKTISGGKKKGQGGTPPTPVPQVVHP